MESPLKELRKRLSFTQQELATLANESQVHISDIEKGHHLISSKLFEFLKEVDVDTAEIDQKQRDYMEYVKNQLKERAKLQKFSN